MTKDFILKCCSCGDRLRVRARSIPFSRVLAHALGWASTSVDRPTGKHICPPCLVRHKSYSPGVPFKFSPFSEMANVKTLAEARCQRVERDNDKALRIVTELSQPRKGPQRRRVKGP